MTSIEIYIAQYYTVLEYCAIFTAVIILISSIDDLFIDAWYWIRQIYRHLTIERRVDYRALTADDMRQQQEKPLAIMIPAWLEYDVIAQMIENMVSVLDYRNYVVFIGTYVNDVATIAEVERMQRRYRQLQRVEVPHDGPTCKADCLNWIVQAISLHEQENNIEFAGMVLHDSEDVLHALELKFFNYLLPRKDMIQLPVMSLERNWYELVAGTYMDEFAEWHAKDLVVRESVAGMVPSAGVGTCFSRRALITLAKETQNQPFNTDTLTEDYDIGERLGRMGMRSIFAHFNVQFRVKRPTWFGLGPVHELILTMPLCVREFFPNTFRTAYRQKARWVLGIGLQSWEQLGWRGSLINKYLLFRDRKGIVTSFVSIFAYVLLLQFVVLYVMASTNIWTVRFPPLFRDGTWLMTVSVLITISLVLRVVQRMYFVTKLYGWEHGLMSAPRMIIGNFINFFAVSRAWKLFLGHLFFGTRMAWDKTMHDFPTTDQLAHKRARLGELLTSWQAVDHNKLESALNDQLHKQMPLGRVLIAKGWLDDETLAEAISFQTGLPRIKLDTAAVKINAGLLPTEICIRWRIAVIDQTASSIVIATANTLQENAINQINKMVGLQIEQQIVSESEIREALRLLSGTANYDNTAPLLGDILIEMALIDRVQFEMALTEYRPQRDGRIGDYLVAQGVVSPSNIERAVQEQRLRTSTMTANVSLPSLESSSV